MEKKGEKTRGSILGLGMDRGVGGIKGGGVLSSTTCDLNMIHIMKNCEQYLGT